MFCLKRTSSYVKEEEQKEDEKGEFGWLILSSNFILYSGWIDLASTVTFGWRPKETLTNEIFKLNFKKIFLHFGTKLRGKLEKGAYIMDILFFFFFFFFFYLYGIQSFILINSDFTHVSHLIISGWVFKQDSCIRKVLNSKHA